MEKERGIVRSCRFRPRLEHRNREFPTYGHPRDDSLLGWTIDEGTIDARISTKQVVRRNETSQKKLAQTVRPAHLEILEASDGTFPETSQGWTCSPFQRDKRGWVTLLLTISSSLKVPSRSSIAIFQG